MRAQAPLPPPHVLRRLSAGVSSAAFAATLAVGLATGLTTGFATEAVAEVPRVAADIPPVHALAARVMQGLGEPALVVPPGASPHDHAMRPSEASALQDADLVVWIGEPLTPWLGGAIATLSGGAQVVSLLDLEGTTRHDYREGPIFDAAAQVGDALGEEAHAGDEHAEEAHAEGAADHAEAAAGEHGHTGGVDPHAWLDPANAVLWLDAIAGALAEMDPEHAEAYRANAEAGRAEIEAAAAEVEALIGPVRGRAYVVAHDAYRYFEEAFALPALGSIADGDAVDPSPARLRAVREAVAHEGAACVLAEPQVDPGLMAAVAEGTGAHLATADPLGGAIEPGPDLYPRLMRDLAGIVAGCLSDGS